MKQKKVKQVSGGSMEPESEYAQFYRAFLGYNFRHIPTGVVLTKAEYFRKLGSKQFPGWELVPYAPENGWKTEQERTRHFKQVEELRKEDQIKRAYGMIP